MIRDDTREILAKMGVGVRVPVVAAVRHGSEVRYVRLGPQFCVRNAVAAASYLQEQAFTATTKAVFSGAVPV